MTRAVINQQPYVTVVSATSAGVEHEIVADTTWLGVGGTAGMKPGDLLNGSLAACIAMTVQIAAVRRGTALESVEVDVEHSAIDANRTHFDCRLTLVGNLTEKERAGLVRVAHHCPITKLLGGKHISIAVLEVTQSAAA